MKKIYTVLLVGFSFFAEAQAPAIEWQKCFGGSSPDMGLDVVQATDGGYVAMGFATSTDGDVTDHFGGSDFWVVKTNTSGQIQWEKSYGGNLNDRPSQIIRTQDGGYLIVGFTTSIDGEAADNDGGQDGMAVKIDSDGNVQWSKCYGGSSWDHIQSVRQLADGNYLLVGHTFSNNGDVSFNHGVEPNINADGWIVKINPTGTIIWEKTYGSTGGEYFRNAQLTADGGMVFIGQNFTSDFSADVTSSHGHYDIWVVKTDASGTLQWQKSFGGSAADAEASIMQMSDGGYLFLGKTSSTDGDVTGNHGQTDCWVVKLDGSGNLLWQKAYGGTLADGTSHENGGSDLLLEDSDGNYIFATQVLSTNGDVSGNHGNVDYWLVKINPSGTILWKKCMGGSGTDYPNRLFKANDGGLMLNGQAWSTNGDVTGSHGNSEMWLVKLAPHLSTDAFENASINIYPNPATSLLHIELPNGIQAEKINITNISGKLVLQIPFTSAVNVEPLAAGTYFMEVISKEKKFQTKFIKQ